MGRAAATTTDNDDDGKKHSIKALEVQAKYLTRWKESSRLVTNINGKHVKVAKALACWNPVPFMYQMKIGQAKSHIRKSQMRTLLFIWALSRPASSLLIPSLRRE
jgi:hypothetical protein